MISKKLMLAGVCSLFILTFSITAYGEPANDDNLFNDALKGYYQKDYRLAIMNFKKLIQRNSESPGAFYYLGYTYYKLGNMKLAQDYFNKAYFIDPTYSPNIPVSGK